MNIFRDNHVNCSNKICIYSQKSSYIIVHISCTLSNIKDSQHEIKKLCSTHIKKIKSNLFQSFYVVNASWK